MSNLITVSEIAHYVSELNRIYKTGNATEHSYRLVFQLFLEKITSGLTVTNEPKRIACGAPDYIVTRAEIPVGYIEAKDIEADLNSRANKTQFEAFLALINRFAGYDGQSIQNSVHLSEIMAAKAKLMDTSFVTPPLIEESGGRHHRVQIIDPATGTGAFLAEVVMKMIEKVDKLDFL